MARREGETPLVEMDDAYLGGVRSGGKRGRGAARRPSWPSRPVPRGARAAAGPVKGFRSARSRVAPSSLTAWAAGAHSTRSPAAIRQSAPGRADRRPAWRHSNGCTMLGNLRDHRDLSQARPRSRRALPRQFRPYNRRYQLETMIPRFVHSAARTEPMPYRLLIAGTFKDGNILCRYPWTDHPRFCPGSGIQCAWIGNLCQPVSRS